MTNMTQNSTNEEFLDLIIKDKKKERKIDMKHLGLLARRVQAIKVSCHNKGPSIRRRHH